MKLKKLSIIVLFMVFFFGEIAITFSFKRENDRNSLNAGIVPLSYNLTNELSSDTITSGVDSLIVKFLMDEEFVFIITM